MLINGSAFFENAFIFFPLLNDTMKISPPTRLVIDTAYGKRKLFYCGFKNGKSRLFNLAVDKLEDNVIDFEIPASRYFDSLYLAKTCPLCHLGDMVIPFIYGKPGKELMNLDKLGKVKLAGCRVSDTSPHFYCKRDLLAF